MRGKAEPVALTTRQSGFAIRCKRAATLTPSPWISPSFSALGGPPAGTALILLLGHFPARKRIARSASPKISLPGRAERDETHRAERFPGCPGLRDRSGFRLLRLLGLPCHVCTSWMPGILLRLHAVRNRPDERPGVDLGGPEVTVLEPRVGRRHWKFRIGSGSEVHSLLGRSGYVRIAAFALRSQACPKETFPVHR